MAMDETTVAVVAGVLVMVVTGVAILCGPRLVVWLLAYLLRDVPGVEVEIRWEEDGA